RSGLEPVATPFVRSRRNRDAARDREWFDQPFADRHRIELEAVAAAKPPVDRRPEHTVTLPSTREVGRQCRLGLEKHLLNRPVAKARAEVRADVPEWGGAPRHETCRRFEVATDPLVGDRHVEEVVGIVDLEAVGGRIATEILASGREPPRPDEEVPVPSE